MKSNIGVDMAILVLMIQTGCAPHPTATPGTSGHVACDLSATLDGKPLPPLQAIQGESCYGEDGGYSIAFSAAVEGPQDRLISVIGIMTITALSEWEMGGSAQSTSLPACVTGAM